MLTDLCLPLSGRFNQFLDGSWSFAEQMEDLQSGRLSKHLAEFRLQSIKLSFLFWVHVLHQAPSCSIQTFDFVNIVVQEKSLVKVFFKFIFHLIINILCKGKKSYSDIVPVLCKIE